MLKLTMERGLVPANDGTLLAFEAALQTLRAVWAPIVEPARQLQLNAFGVDPENASWGVASRGELYDEPDGVLAGEVFVIKSGLVVITARPNDQGARIRFVANDDGSMSRVQGDIEEIRISVSVIAREDPESFLGEVRKAFAGKLPVSLAAYKYKNERFEQLRKEAVIEEIPEGEEYLTASRALSERDCRTLAVGIKSSRGLLESDVARLLQNDADVEAVIERTVGAGIAESMLVIVCTVTGNQVARVSDMSKISVLAEQGLLCACGRPIEKESPERLLSISPVGVLLLDKSRWMSVLVRDQLQRLGVPEQDILLECQLGSDEIDCIALISGELAIFELKDKEFSIGNAYSFGAKVSIVKPAHAVIVTTEAVSKDVRSHFDRTHAVEPRRYVIERANRNVIHYVEGAQFLTGLAPVVGSIFAKDGTTILDEALRLLPARADSVVEHLQTFE